MPIFNYQAIDAAGQEVDGNRQAGSIAEVQDHLYRQGLVPVSVKLSKQGHVKAEAGETSRLGKIGQSWGSGSKTMKDPLAFTQELSRLLSAKFNVERSLGILAKELTYPEAGSLLASVRKGVPFHEALGAFPNLFDSLYTNMVRAGETSGALADTISELTRLLERQKQTRDAIRSATLYPLILMFASGGALLFLLGFVVPQFEALLISSRVAVSGWLGFLFTLSHGIVAYWLHGLVGLLAILLLLDRVFKIPKVQSRWNEVMLKAPVLGPYIARKESARFTRVLGIMLERHISPLAAVDIATGTVQNSAIAVQLSGIRDIMERGEGLAEPLSQLKLLPPVVARMADIGEETGELGKAFEHAADILDAEVETDLKRFLTILEPVVILAVGAMVGGIVISILAALMSVTDYIG